MKESLPEAEGGSAPHPGVAAVVGCRACRARREIAQSDRRSHQVEKLARWSECVESVEAS